ncbi:transcriptional regulator [Collimonas humicola]|uniref:transcriptional regulator n=1 Tax=Collimonas humicola TaxID=2825886 RepID=UPI001B8A9136|nr:YdaS family helix-turn-helix protein [Collimonas humicola]
MGEIMERGIAKAVRLAGSQTALGKLVRVSPQAVQKWVARGIVPARRCRVVEKALSGAVTRYELNEEAFGSPDK